MCEKHYILKGLMNLLGKSLIWGTLVLGLMYYVHVYEHANMEEFKVVRDMYLANSESMQISCLMTKVVSSNIWLRRAKTWDDSAFSWAFPNEVQGLTRIVLKPLNGTLETKAKGRK